MNNGAIAEQAAADFLVSQGLKIVARNWRCRQGEIDLIAKEGGSLVFVEVRLRSSSRFGSAAESITAVKRARLVLTARHYLQMVRFDCPCRFDVICFDGQEMTWIKDCIQS